MVNETNVFESTDQTGTVNLWPLYWNIHGAAEKKELQAILQGEAKEEYVPRIEEYLSAFITVQGEREIERKRGPV